MTSLVATLQGPQLSEMEKESRRRQHAKYGEISRALPSTARWALIDAVLFSHPRQRAEAVDAAIAWVKATFPGCFRPDDSVEAPKRIRIRGRKAA